MYAFVFCNSLSVSSLFFFFFKQKTAYEMRISDWSSDVCSSDLPAAGAVPAGRRGYLAAEAQLWPQARAGAAGPVYLRRCRPRQVDADGPEIGRASCRERVCQYV